MGKPLQRDGLGIVNPYGQFWTTEIFADEESAKAYFYRFWRGVKDAPSWDSFRVVPATLEISARDSKEARNGG